MSRKPYVQPQSSDWWVKNPYYRFYMLREATSIPVFLYSLALLAGVFNLTSGRTEFIAWVNWMTTPYMLVFQVIALAAALLHAVTWFQLTPKILVIRLGDKALPGSYVSAAHYAAFVILSLAIPLSVWFGLKG